MSELTKTIKLHINVSSKQEVLFRRMTEQYRQACDFVSQYIFDNQFNLSYPKVAGNPPALAVGSMST